MLLEGQYCVLRLLQEFVGNGLRGSDCSRCGFSVALNDVENGVLRVECIGETCEMIVLGLRGVYSLEIFALLLIDCEHST